MKPGRIIHAADLFCGAGGTTTLRLRSGQAEEARRKAGQ